MRDRLDAVLLADWRAMRPIAAIVAEQVARGRAPVDTLRRLDLLIGMGGLGSPQACRELPGGVS